MSHEAIMTQGVVADVTEDTKDALLVLPGEDMKILVNPGYCWIKGGIGVFFGCAPATVQLSVSSADATYTRIDRVIVRKDSNNKTFSIEVLKGVASSAPEAPALTRNGTVDEICLAEITVPAGTIEITQSMIVDKRHDTSVCGISQSALNKLDTSKVFAGYEAQWAELMGQLAEDPAGNLQFQIGNLNNLETENKENLVEAINEIDLNIGDLTSLKTEDKENLVNAINEVIDTPRKVIEERTTLFSGTATWDETRESYQCNSFKLAQTNLEEYDFIEIVFPPATPIKYYDSNASRYMDETIYLTTNTIKFKVTIPMPTSSSTRWIYDNKTYTMSFLEDGGFYSTSFKKNPFYVQSRKEKNSVIYHNDELTICHDCENVSTGVYVYPMKADIYGVKVKAVNEL